MLHSKGAYASSESRLSASSSSSSPRKPFHRIPLVLPFHLPAASNPKASSVVLVDDLDRVPFFFGCGDFGFSIAMHCSTKVLKAMCLCFFLWSLSFRGSGIGEEDPESRVTSAESPSVCVPLEPRIDCSEVAFALAAA